MKETVIETRISNPGPFPCWSPSSVLAGRYPVTPLPCTVSDVQGGKNVQGRGEKVVYPAHGVGEIEAVRSQAISGTEKKFYMLRILDTDMKIMVPVDNAMAVGLRKIIDKTTVHAGLPHSPGKEEGAHRPADMEPPVPGIHRKDQDRLGYRDCRRAQGPVPSEGRQGAFLW